jgi:hypothetical protein
LYEALEKVVPSDSDEGEDWATVPFLRLQLTFAEVDGIRELDSLEGARAVLEQARVNQIDAEALRLFGVGRVEPFAPLPLARGCLAARSAKLINRVDGRAGGAGPCRKPFA